MKRIHVLGLLTLLIWGLLFVLAFAQPGPVPQPEGEKGRMVFMLVNLLLGSSLVPYLTSKLKAVKFLAGPGAIISSGILGIIAAMGSNLVFGAGLSADYLLLLGLGGNQTAASFVFEVYKTFFKKA